MGSTNQGLKLQPGKFYFDKENKRWCCFKVDPEAPVQAQAWCVKVNTHEVEYFFLDGRYDESGNREHTLVREAP
jgi:hypothetical protein